MVLSAREMTQYDRRGNVQPSNLNSIQYDLKISCEGYEFSVGDFYSGGGSSTGTVTKTGGGPEGFTGPKAVSALQAHLGILGEYYDDVKSFIDGPKFFAAIKEFRKIAQAANIIEG